MESRYEKGVPLQGIDVVERAYQLMRDMGWSRGAFARNSIGDTVSTADGEACAFCAGGALWRAALELEAFGDGRYSAARDLVASRIAPDGTIQGLASWNDTVGKETVLETFVAVLACAGVKV